MGEEELVLGHFFSNSDKPIFALQGMPAAVQGYFYMGVSRFPKMRERFLKFLQEKGCLEAVAAAIAKGGSVEQALKPLSEFSAEKNKQVFFDFGHKSAGEGSSLFLVSEANPIYATEEQQDFYYPMTTMEFSTRYAKKFGIDAVYYEPKLMETEFGAEAREVIAGNLQLYEKGFDVLMQQLKEKKAKEELPEKVSVLDSLRFLVPLACHTSVILGGNSRAVMEHFGKLLASNDSFVQHYARECVKEAEKLMPEYFSGLKADTGVIKREEALQRMGKELFGNEFLAVKKDVTMLADLPMEEAALSQILYPYCSLPFEKVLEKVSGLTEKEKKEVFDAAVTGRQNRQSPARGFETRPIVFEIESPWAFWKDFKRNRMNLRFHQPLRGEAGFDVPELVKGSPIEADYKKALEKTSGLVERVFQKHGTLSRAVAAQGNRKRYLMCMGARQLTVLTELRTSGEGDKGYRRIASRMIELAREKNERLFAHVKDNFKERQ